MDATPPRLVSPSSQGTVMAASSNPLPPASAATSAAGTAPVAAIKTAGADSRRLSKSRWGPADDHGNPRAPEAEVRLHQPDPAADSAVPAGSERGEWPARARQPSEEGEASDVGPSSSSPRRDSSSTTSSMDRSPLQRRDSRDDPPSRHRHQRDVSPERTRRDRHEQSEGHRHRPHNARGREDRRREQRRSHGSQDDGRRMRTRRIEDADFARPWEDGPGERVRVHDHHRSRTPHGERHLPPLDRERRVPPPYQDRLMHAAGSRHVRDDLRRDRQLDFRERLRDERPHEDRSHREHRHGAPETDGLHDSHRRTPSRQSERFEQPYSPPWRHRRAESLPRPAPPFSMSRSPTEEPEQSQPGSPPVTRSESGYGCAWGHGEN